jgi:SAM-dependent methyltransferase
MREPRVLLDAGGGSGEFINGSPAEERWMVDLVDFPRNVDRSVRILIGDILSVDLPESYFDGIFVSNVLEHLASQEAVATLLTRLLTILKPGGLIAVMGPNFRYCSKNYFDCADHTLPLTHVAVEEHLYAAGFETVSVQKRYLPYSFRGVLPPSPRLTQAYLKLRPAHAILGKQFLLIATRR